MSAPILITQRTRSATVSLIRNAALALGAAGYFGFEVSQRSSGPWVWMFAVLLVIISVLLLVQVLFLIKGRHPLVIYEDHIEINSVLTVRFDRSKITGQAVDPKTGQTCFLYSADGGPATPVTIPWQWIEETEDQVMEVLNRNG